MFGVPLWSVYAAASVVALAMGDMRLARAGLVLLANWGILTAFATFTGDQFCVPMNMTIDWLTVLVVAFRIETIWQAAILFSFGVGMVFHADFLVKDTLGYGITANGAATMVYQYWWRFHYLAWAQAALLVGWTGYGGGKRLVRLGSDLRSLSDDNQRGALAIRSIGGTGW